MAKRSDKDKPYISNYPPLYEWLQRIEARCMTQVRGGGTDDDPRSYIETYLTPNGRNFIVVVHADQHGWEVFTPCDSNKIEDTLADAELRLGLTMNPKPGAAA
jgi:hypothetical protein